MALDGEVKAGEFAEPICELELELLSGDTCAVLKLANQLVSQKPVYAWQFEQSSARLSFGRGMQRANSNRRGILKVPAKASIEQGWKRRWSWHYHSGSTHEELWVRGVKGRKPRCWRQWVWCVTF